MIGSETERQITKIENIKVSKMKIQKTYTTSRQFAIALIVFCSLLMFQGSLKAQDSTVVQEVTEPVAKPKLKPVKNTFQSVWIIDNQTVMVPIKGTFEMDIMHRFGTINKGYEDFWGFFAPSNIRLGVNYSPINKLNVGIGITKEHKLWDLSVKYSLISQTKHKYPVSITYYGNVAYDTRKSPVLFDNSDIIWTADRLYYFHQLIVARKLTEKISLQIAPSLTWQNAVPGYFTKNDSTGKEIYRKMNHAHFAISVAGRYKLTNVTSLMFNYDQPITKHHENNPNPNVSVGVEFNTSNHAFQLFFTNYFSLNQQRNNLFNENSPFSYTDAVTGKKVSGGQFLIGFNITRLWNF